MKLVAWFRRLSAALEARLARLEVERWNRCQVDDLGLHVSHKNRCVARLPWSDIAEIVAFKQDLYTVDQICVGFRTTESDKYICIEEENPEYDRVIKLVEERFQLRQDWWSTVAFPAFE